MKENPCRGGRGKELRERVSVSLNTFVMFISGTGRSRACTEKILIFFFKIFLYRNLLAQTTYRIIAAWC